MHRRRHRLSGCDLGPLSGWIGVTTRIGHVMGAPYRLNYELRGSYRRHKGQAYFIIMTLRVFYLRRLIPLIIVTVISVACPRLCEAKCHAADFDFRQIQAITNNSESSVENLAALIKSAPGTKANFSDAMGLLAAAKAVEADGKVVAYFASLLFIHSDVTTPADKGTVDKFIGMEAALIYRELQSDADFLTQSPPGATGYANDEIKDARDLIRKMKSLFSCAADDK